MNYDLYKIPIQLDTLAISIFAFCWYTGATFSYCENNASNHPVCELPSIFDNEHQKWNALHWFKCVHLVLRGEVGYSRFG